jgi:hypothetical protein
MTKLPARRKLPEGKRLPRTELRKLPRESSREFLQGRTISDFF